MEFLDLHTHILKETYKKDYEFILMKFIDVKGAKAINIALDVDTSFESLRLAKTYPNHFKSTIGLHPTSKTSNLNEDIKSLEKLYFDNQNKIIAVGEIGLNYVEPFVKGEQIKKLKKLIELSIKINLPIILHSRNSHEDLYNVLKQYKNLPTIILHSWTGDLELTNKFLEMNSYFSFSGIVTFKNANEVRESMKQVPIERIFYETDCPWLSPVPKRGQINIPQNSIYIRDFIAKEKEIKSEELDSRIEKNFSKVFNIKGWLNES